MTLRVFLVEDEAHIAEYVQAAFNRHRDVEVVGTVKTEHDAKAWLKGNPHTWDITVADLFLAQGSGAGVVRYCRLICPKPIVVFTGCAFKPMLNHVRKLGADAIFSKSDGVDGLIEYCLSFRRMA